MNAESDDPETPRAGKQVGDSEYMTSFAKGLAVIESFGRLGERLTIAEAARFSGLDRAATRRCLRTLVALGYAETDGRYFRLTARVLGLAVSYLSTLPNLLQPTLEALVAEIGEPCSASVLDDTEVIYIARAAQQRATSIALNVGARLPAYCSSMGRIWLASLSDAEVIDILARSDIKPLTNATRTDPAEILSDVRRAREQGYSYVDQELISGLRSISVPVVKPSGQMVAALNVGSHISQISEQAMVRTILPQLLAAQADLVRVIR